MPWVLVMPPWRSRFDPTDEGLIRMFLQTQVAQGLIQDLHGAA